MSTEVAEVRKGRKFEQVLDGARRVFLRDGYERASVDDIAREAGVSKATLYAYFADKRVMFTQVLTEECRLQANQVDEQMDPLASAEAFLSFAGKWAIRFMLSDFGRSLFRIVVSEVSRFPELAREFEANGPGLLRDRMVSQLRALAERGELKIEDFDLASDQFLQLCKAYIHDRMMLGLIEDIRPEDIDRSVGGAVEMFMARYGTR